MSKTNEESCLGWVSLGEDEQRRAKEYLAQFQAENTLDELGFGIIRDAFAELFFPATNTIMTRTRYLVFLPALFLQIEREKLSGQAAARRLTQMENELRESLRKEVIKDVIGDVSKEALKRYPSSIYWNAIRRLGIFLNPNSGLAYYHDHLADLYSAMKAETDDDGLSHVSHAERRNWDKTLCDMIADGRSVAIRDGKLPESLNFSLTRSEARYLKDKYCAMAESDGQPSLISDLLKRGDDTDFDFPWDVSPPEALAGHVDHARRFSMFARGATLQYWHLLQRERKKSGITESECDFAGAFAHWWTVTREELAGWQVDSFVTIAGAMKAIRKPGETLFIKRWFEMNKHATSAEEMFESEEAEKLIRHRERVTRPTKSRLRFPEYLKRWKPPKPAEIDAMRDGSSALRFGYDYRAKMGRIFVSDILQGLKAKP